MDRGGRGERKPKELKKHETSCQGKQEKIKGYMAMFKRKEFLVTEINKKKLVYLSYYGILLGCLEKINSLHTFGDQKKQGGKQA